MVESEKLQDSLRNIQEGEFWQHLQYLYDRWEDEKNYEDFNEYKESVKKYLPVDYKFISMEKNPFQVTTEMEGVEDIQIVFTVTSKNMSLSIVET